MVYVYKKRIGNKDYYYLRVSKRQGKKLITKDLAYLGNTLSQVQENLKKQPEKDIRKAHRNISRFLESNIFLEKVRAAKPKHTIYLPKELAEEIEACRLHWQKKAKKQDPQTFREQLKNFAIEFAFNTTSLEGNTITLKEAAQLLTEEITPKNRTLREIYDVQNTERVFLEILEKPPAITHETIIRIHEELMRNIDVRTGYRTADVRVLHSRFEATPAPYVKTDMDILIRWYKEQKTRMHPFVIAGMFHHKFEKIHPFFDGNGRTGRMLMNIILLKTDYPPLIISKKNRPFYLESMAKADKARLSEITPEAYKDLMECTAQEYKESYWNNFL